MDAQLENVFADGITVAELARFYLPQPKANSRRGGRVANFGKPFREWFPTVLAL